MQAKCVKGYHLEGDQIVSPPCQAEVEGKSEAETRARGEANEFRKGACNMDTQLGYGKFVSDFPMNIFFLPYLIFHPDHLE